MQRYFVKNEAIINDIVKIMGDDYFHITKVMRMKCSDNVIICNEDKSWLCSIKEITSDSVYLKILEEVEEKKELPIGITIAQGIIRKEKMEEVIDKITQMGALYYIPIQMDRCNVKINSEKIDKKIERMNKIAKEAAEQSHRSKILKVKYPIDFIDMIYLKNNYDLCLYAYENHMNTKTLKEVFSNRSYSKVIILVGPEGGISDKEAKILNENNFIAVSLGPRILRTEVAPTYILSAISYELEE